MLINIHEFDDSINPLTRNPIAFSACMCAFAPIVCTWRQFYCPHAIYKLWEMPALHTYGNIIPTFSTFFALIIILITRIIWSNSQEVKHID
jgi:hypothetical protein